MENNSDLTFCVDSVAGEQWQYPIRSPYSDQVLLEDHLPTNLITSEQNPQMMMNQTAAQTQPSRQRQSAELTPSYSQSKRKISEITAVDPRTSKKREYDRHYRQRVKERKTQNESDLKKVKDENAELKHNVESLENDNLSLSQKLDKLEKENDNLKQKLEKKKEKIRRLENENGTLRNQYIESLTGRNALMNQHFETQSNEPGHRRSEFHNIGKQLILPRTSNNFTGGFGVETEGRSMHSNAVALLKVSK
ncbi:hypothetical protein SLEP1_g53736 [Rubroshorea leprosula]|uniref:BZIP domain-containing protein n=1 Tax=Rubroshorea leprosula TaxID=152421 RepID=A0AAV5ME67_9ROSI|nr:hypothetical protein SLEP1_g53736 [Rubroshorea leprosula]